MKPITPRSPRYPAEFPVEFIAGGRVISGNCLNLSDSGLLASFDEPLELWSTGEIRLHTGQRSRKFSARICRIEGRTAGLTFDQKSDHDHTFVSTLINALTGGRSDREAVPPPF